MTEGYNMGIVGRRKSGPQPSDRVEWVTSTARRVLAERGVETTIAYGAAPEDVTLLAADGMSYPLFNALAKTHGASAHEAARIITAHLDGLLTAERWPAPHQLPADQLRRQVRTRILSGGLSGPNEPTFGYARPFSDGLIVALCVDFPDSVSVIGDASVDGLAVEMEELYEFGQRNTDQEPVGDRFEPSPGLTVVTGDSLFIASKAANLPALFDVGPFGTLFTVPHRHMLIALPITGPRTLRAADYLVGVTARVLSSGPAPGGVLSPDVHFSRDGTVSQVSSTDDTGAVTMTVDERLRRALDEAVGH